MRKFALGVVAAGLVALSAAPAFATSCGQFVDKCKTEGNRNSENVAKCEAAGVQCKKSGEWVGPVTGKRFKATP